MIKKAKETDKDNILNRYNSDENKKAISNYFLNEEEDFHHLYISKKSLIAVIDNLEIPAWTLSRSNSIINYDELKDIFDYLTKIKEQENRNQFFLLLEESEYEFFQNLIPRYNFYLEHIVFPNTLTTYENIDHDVLSYQYSEKKMLIYLCVLKNEYRTLKK